MNGPPTSQPDGERLPSSLLVGCVETGGVTWCEADRLVFVPGDDGPTTEVRFHEIAEMRLGGRTGADANRIDLTLLDGRRLTFLIVGRDRLVAGVQTAQGWSSEGAPNEGREHAPAPSDV